MVEEGGGPAVVLCHDVHALDEGGAVVGGGETFGEVVGEGGVGIDDGYAFARGQFHDAYAPVVVGAVAVVEVVGYALGEVFAYVEALVAYEHAL